MLSSSRHLRVVSTIIFALQLAIAESGDTHIPTLNEISQINDPVLKDVFASSGIPHKGEAHAFEENPRLPAPGPMQPVERRYYGEVPIEQHQQPLGQVPAGRDPMAAAVNSGVQVFANSADALYRGAASVGQAFGINPKTYEAPLLSAASNFFGRR